jgi:hypothetical protein
MISVEMLKTLGVSDSYGKEEGNTGFDRRMLSRM